VEQSRVRLFRQLLAIPHLEEVIVMSDEKYFTIEAPINPQNERVNTTGKKRAIRPESLLLPQGNLSFSRKLMVFCAFSMRGKVCIHVFNEKESEDGERYCQLLVETVLPALLQVYPEGTSIFQQDGASPHTCNETQGLLKELSERFGQQYISSKEWPPYSPDANVCDYRAWADAQRVVYANGTPSSMAELKARIMEWWEGLAVEQVQKWMRELRPRMEKIVAEGGRQIEQYFNKI
jgi:hypothetical protein